MNRKILVWIFFVFNSFLFSFSSFGVEGGDVGLFYNLLKDSQERYEITGTVCEQVARKELQRTYPEPDFDIETGIAYVEHGRVLGELDIVVFRNADHKAILVGEVKCWRNLKKARRKA